jgi:prefoldin subunit 5
MSDHLEYNVQVAEALCAIDIRLQSIDKKLEALHAIKEKVDRVDERVERIHRHEPFVESLEGLAGKFYMRCIGYTRQINDAS